jgi:hypothetical protein
VSASYKYAAIYMTSVIMRCGEGGICCSMNSILPRCTRRRSMKRPRSSSGRYYLCLSANGCLVLMLMCMRQTKSTEVIDPGNIISSKRPRTKVDYVKLNAAVRSKSHGIGST